MVTHRCRLVFLGMFTVVAYAGCSQPDVIGPTVPVSGKVTIDGRPLPSGMVNYTPDEQKGNKGKALGIGPIDNGDYTLKATSATGSKPGLPEGWYKVTVTSGAPPTQVAKDAAGGKGGPMPGAGVPIASKYASAQTTPLVIEVKKGAPAGTYDLKVTSN